MSENAVVTRLMYNIDIFIKNHCHFKFKKINYQLIVDISTLKMITNSSL